MNLTTSSVPSKTPQQKKLRAASKSKGRDVSANRSVHTIKVDLTTAKSRKGLFLDHRYNFSSETTEQAGKGAAAARSVVNLLNFYNSR